MKLRVIAALSLAAAIAASSAPAAGRHDQLPLRAGSAGPRVAALQWLLAGHRPNVFTKVKPTLRQGGYTKGVLGARTKHAIVAYKWRLGYPAELVKPVAGPYFFRLLKGEATRPPAWIANAARRVKAVEPGASAWALKAKAYELRLLELDIHEIPDGSNRGPAISYGAHGVPALQSATGAYGLAWCVSTQQTVFKAIGYGTFADATAGVYYAVDFYAARNLVFAKPKVGSLVAFVDYDTHGRRIPGTGHMGYVVKIAASGFVSIEGNASNRLLERFHPFGDRGAVFIRLPGVA